MPHATSVPFTKTLVVDVGPHVFQLLTSKKKARAWGWVEAYSAPRLTFYKFMEHHTYKVMI